MKIYNNYNYLLKKNLIKNVFSLIIITSILYVFFLYTINIPFKKYKKFNMTLLEDNIYEIYLLEEDIDLFKNTLLYNKEKYSFKIKDIDFNYYFNMYRRITISVNFKINIPNKIYEILIFEKETTFLKEFLKEVL